MRVVIVGAGAAGCFCAIQLKRQNPEVEVIVLEGGRKALAKLAITGGGRCNFTNTFNGVRSLSEAYPRGERLMKRALARFSQKDVCEWFENEGVPYVVQPDECIFPASQDAMQIVTTLERRMRSFGVRLLCSHKVTGIIDNGNGYTVNTENGASFEADKVVVTTGGSPQLSGLSMLDGLDLEIVDPVPSLFTFNVDDKKFRELMGTVVEDAATSIPGTKFGARGPLLITHWGMSGPAALKLSAYAARHLAEKGYHSPVSVNWMAAKNVDEVRALLQKIAKENAQKLVTSSYPEELNSHLWKYLAIKALQREDARWNGIAKKDFNRLVEVLTNDSYTMTGKSRFREEFVTCGGIALSEISLNTLESKKHPGLHFAGEVLDVDAITGGFNLQAAWSMGYAVAEAIASSLSALV